MSDQTDEAAEAARQIAAGHAASLGMTVEEYQQWCAKRREDALRPPRIRGVHVNQPAPRSIQRRR